MHRGRPWWTLTTWQCLMCSSLFYCIPVLMIIISHPSFFRCCFCLSLSFSLSAFVVVHPLITDLVSASSASSHSLHSITFIFCGLPFISVLFRVLLSLFMCVFVAYLISVILLVSLCVLSLFRCLWLSSACLSLSFTYYTVVDSPTSITILIVNHHVECIHHRLYRCFRRCVCLYRPVKYYRYTQLHTNPRLTLLFQCARA